MEQAILDQMKEDLTKAVAAGVEELETPIMFYSKAGHFTLIVNPGKNVTLAGGAVERIGEKEAQFNAIASGVKQEDGSVAYYGWYVATDPEIALALLNNGYYPNKKRNNQIIGDVMLPADYMDLVTPKSELLRQAQARLTATTNELAEFLRRQSESGISLQAKEEENAILRDQLKKMVAENKKLKGDKESA